MARPSKVSAADIERAALVIARDGGMDALTARAVADVLGVSTQPVYSTWGSMDALKARVGELLQAEISAYLREPELNVPPMLSVGLRSIRLAQEHPQLFALAAEWMRRALDHAPPPDVLDAMRADPRLATATDADLTRVNALLWIFTQGLAAMVSPPTALTLDTARGYLIDMGEAVIGTEARRRSPA